MADDTTTTTRAAAAPTFKVGQVAKAGEVPVLVVGVTPAAGDVGPIYDTVALPGAVTRYFGEDLTA